jgi:type VI secretion system protein ImpB
VVDTFTANYRRPCLKTIFLPLTFFLKEDDMPESLQHTLDRVRSPRVQITYDVEIGDAIEMKEIPFVVGVLADLSGKPDESLPKVKDRKFVEIDRDNFNQVLAGMKPRLAYRVDNKLTDDDSKMAVELRFKSLDDFHPERVAEQVTPLRKLVEARKRLSDLLAKLDGNDTLDELLQDVLASTESIEKLGKEAGVREDKE